MTKKIPKKSQTKLEAKKSRRQKIYPEAAVAYAAATPDNTTNSKEIDRLNSEFVSVASHQLRTPLTAIKWIMEMVLDGDAGEVTADQREYFEQVYESNERMIRLVNDLRRVSQIEMGRITVKPKPRDLVQLARKIIQEMEPTVTERGQTITLECDGSLPKIPFDPEYIRQVIQNLLSNASRRTPAGGEIKVRIYKKGKDLVFMVSDTGYGIPANQQPQVFTKFFRGNNIVQKQTEGTGLGLYIAKGMVEASGGKIWFDSEENKGSTFYFSMPL